MTSFEQAARAVMCEAKRKVMILLQLSKIVYPSTYQSQKPSTIVCMSIRLEVFSILTFRNVGMMWLSHRLLTSFYTRIYVQVR